MGGLLGTTGGGLVGSRVRCLGVAQVELLLARAVLIAQVGFRLCSRGVLGGVLRLLGETDDDVAVLEGKAVRRLVRLVHDTHARPLPSSCIRYDGAFRAPRCPASSLYRAAVAAMRI